MKMVLANGQLRARTYPGRSALLSKRPHGQGLLNRWGMSTGMVTNEAHDLGTVYITFVEIVLSPFASGLRLASDLGDTLWMRGSNYQWLTAARYTASKYFVQSVPAVRSYTYLASVLWINLCGSGVHSGMQFHSC